MNLLFFASNSKELRIKMVSIFFLQDLLKQSKRDLNENASFAFSLKIYDGKIRLDSFKIVISNG